RLTSPPVQRRRDSARLSVSRVCEQMTAANRFPSRSGWRRGSEYRYRLPEAAGCRRSSSSRADWLARDLEAERNWRGHPYYELRRLENLTLCKELCSPRPRPVGSNHE